MPSALASDKMAAAELVRRHRQNRHRGLALDHVHRRAGRDVAGVHAHSNRAGEGWFAQPTNIGRWYRQAFSVVPSAQVRVGYDLTSRLRLTIGYEAFFWTHMLRAPNQIDRNINLDRAIGLAAGPALPSPSPNFTNFWAQGFTAGLQFNY